MLTPFELEWEMDSEEDEEETLEECRRIFNEAHSTSLAGGPTKEERPLVKTKRPTELEPAVPTKKRVAHNPELVKVIKKLYSGVTSAISARCSLISGGCLVVSVTCTSARVPAPSLGDEK